MTLLEEMQNLLKEEPGLLNHEVEDSISDVTQVLNEFQDSGRWSERWSAVFKRDNEYVRLNYEVPATELQEGSDFYSTVEAVEPHEETRVIVTYRKVL